MTPPSHALSPAPLRRASASLLAALALRLRRRGLRRRRGPLRVAGRRGPAAVDAAPLVAHRRRRPEPLRHHRRLRTQPPLHSPRLAAGVPGRGWGAPSVGAAGPGPLGG